MGNPDTFEHATILATDGISLTARVYEPPRTALLSVLVLPGIGVPQRVFRHVAAWLSARGVRVVSVDYRGVAESLHPDALATASLSHWAACDAVGALRFTERLAAGGPVLLLAHSFGGQALGFSDEFRRLRAAILVGSQLGSPRYWDAPARWKVALYWHLVLPLAAASFELIPAWTGLGEPLPRGVGTEWARWGRAPDWLLSHVPEAAARYAAFDRPLRAYAMSDDPIAPPRAVTALLEQFRGTPVERIDLHPAHFATRHLGHLGVFRPGKTERLWAEFLEYALAHADGGAVATGRSLSSASTTDGLPSRAPRPETVQSHTGVDRCRMSALSHDSERT